MLRLRFDAAFATGATSTVLLAVWGTVVLAVTVALAVCGIVTFAVTVAVPVAICRAVSFRCY